jgi:hypothetical protein
MDFLNSQDTGWYFIEELIGGAGGSYNSPTNTKVGGFLAGGAGGFDPTSSPSGQIPAGAGGKIGGGGGGGGGVGGIGLIILYHN